MPRRILTVHCIALAAALGISARSAPPQPAPVLPPVPVRSLPSALQDDDLELTLTSLETGLPGPSPTSEPKEGETWVRFRTKIRWADRPARALLSCWHPRKITLYNAADEEWNPHATSSAMDGKGEGSIAFVAPTWSPADPWRFSIEMARSAGVGLGKPWDPFHDDELWLVRSVPIPAEGTNAAFSSRVTGPGLAVEVLGVSGAGSVLPDGFGHRIPQPTVHVQLRGQTRGYRLELLGCETPDGRTVPRGASSEGFGKLAGRAALGLRVPPGTPSVNLVFALNRSRFFDFVMAPAGQL